MSARHSISMPNAGEKRSDSVRSIQRGLDVLSEVNRSGGIRVSELAQRLSLARPTVYRLLETLEELGYVRRSGSDDRFRVTRKASSLGDGYDPGLIVSEAAAPVIGELSKRLLWPIDLTIYENAAMVVQETTHAQSPLSIDRGMIGRRLPMLRTSSGRAYLAFCSAAEREIIVKHIARIDDPEDRPFLQRDYLDRTLSETRARGFGLRAEGEYNAKTSSIAVPVIKSNDVLGCISIIWIRSALDPTRGDRPVFRAIDAGGGSAGHGRCFDLVRVGCPHGGQKHDAFLRRQAMSTIDCVMQDRSQLADLDADVVIVGYGPVGATLANLLGLRGVRTVVLEREHGAYHLPRAVHFDDEVMRIFETVGLSDAIVTNTVFSPGMHFVDSAGRLMLDWSRPPGVTPQGWHPSYRFHQPELEGHSA